ncbi:hypothetical protein DPEC_G00354110 [Dallia pectoralis]|uniref:Uncharacterized protein n=1 Tax=Dallia pectoralis TaxID=75939 RepID=A0ACC2F315_DALPE|nr:hypothetical protein DPEC_G00354110 [Dallia pectoralis]
MDHPLKGAFVTVIAEQNVYIQTRYGETADLISRDLDVRPDCGRRLDSKCTHIDASGCSGIQSDPLNPQKPSESARKLVSIRFNCSGDFSSFGHPGVSGPGLCESEHAC